MATKGYRHGDISDDGVLEEKEYQPQHNSEERYSGDAEKGPTKNVGYKGKDDPFGDETNSEVKYRTMAWW